MPGIDENIITQFRTIFTSGADDPEKLLEAAFLELLPPEVPGADLYLEARSVEKGEGLAILLGEILLTLTDSCGLFSVYAWPGEHRKFIGRLLTEYGFPISPSLAEGFPRGS